jgi:hypothetical protein
MSIDKSLSPHSSCTRPPFAASAPLPRRSRHQAAHAAPMTVLAYARLATLSTIAAVMRHQRRYWACASFVCPSALGACHFSSQLMRNPSSRCQDVQKRKRNQHERQTRCDSTMPTTDVQRTIERTVLLTLAYRDVVVLTARCSSEDLSSEDIPLPGAYERRSTQDSRNDKSNRLN